MLDPTLTSPYLISQLQIKVFHPNESKVEQPIGKGKGRERVREGVGADFMS
jgi:hypothetical protein